MSVKLYEIPAAWMAILEALEEGMGELTPELEARAQELLGASKDKLEAAGLAMRNIELHAKQAEAQARVFADEAARCNAIAKQFEAAADRLGALMAPALEITGNVKTAAGTIYARKNTSWAFELKPGCQAFDLDVSLWRQKEPELNKMALRKLAEAGTLPEEVLAMKTESVSVCLKAPAAKKDAKDESAA